MVSSQQFVIGWIECAVAGTILFASAKLVVDRLRQPVDRVNLIVMSMMASAVVPLLLSFASLPGWRLGLFANDAEQVASLHASRRTRISRQLAEAPDALMRPAEQLEPRGAFHSGPRDAEGKAAATTKKADTAPTVSLPPPDAASRARAAPSNSFSSWSLAATTLLLAHGLAIAWFTFQWMLGTMQLRNLSRRARAPDQSLLDVWRQVSHERSCSVRLLVSTEITVPTVFGWRRPTILLPSWMATGDRTAVRFCLAHEWSHVNCGDLPRWQLINLCQLLFWYQPLFWMLRRELRICQDLIADDLAAGATGDQFGRIEYSNLLLTIAKQAISPRVGGAMAFYDCSSPLSRRIKALLTDGQPLRSRSTRTFYLLSGLCLLITSLLVGSLRLSTARAEDDTQDQPQPAQTADASRPTGDHEQAADPGGMKIVRGRVVDATGEPIAGAQLWLPLQYQPKRTVQTTADDAGHFELRCPADWISPRVSRSAWTVWFYAPGYSIQSQSVYEVIRGSSEQEYTIQLPPESDTRFRVLTPEGQPLAGVLVQPQNYKTSVGYALVPEEMLPVVSARTDTNGLVTLPAIQSDLLFRLEMSNDEFGRQTIRMDYNSAMPDREIRLRPTATIKGRLVGDDPTWVRGVRLAFTTDNRDEGKEPQGIADVVTDDQGLFEVPVIASGGPLRPYVNLDPELPVRPLLRDDRYLTAGETLQLEIPLVAAPLVHGKVVVKSTGQPVANAEISLGYGGFRQSDLVITDETGRYEGRALPGDVRVHIIALPRGLVQLGAPWNEPYQVPANVEAFELPTIEVVGTREVSGQLIDTNDQPLANISVMAVEENRRYGFGTSDAEGRFKLDVPDGVDTRVEVYLEDRGQEPVVVVQQDPLIVRYGGDVREKEMEAERALKADVILTGRVLISDEPLAGVPIILKRGAPVWGASSERTGTRYSPLGEAMTDANGEYRLAGLKAGDTYFIEIKPPFPAADPTWRHQSPYRQSLPEDANGEVALPDAQLERLTQTLAGVVVDPAGQPVAGATVSAQLRSGQSLPRLTETGPPPWTKSDHQGRFQLQELPEQPLSIMAYFANPKGGRIRYPAKLNVDMNQQNIRIVLDPSLRDEEEQ